VILSFAIATYSMAQEKSPNVQLPSTEAARHVEAYLKAFNAGAETDMRSFFESHAAKSALAEVPVEQRLSRYRQMKQRLGSLTLVKVLGSSEDLVSIVAKPGNGGPVQLDFQCESTAPHGLLGIRVEDIGDQDEAQPAGTRKGSVEELVKSVSQYLSDLSKADAFSGVVLIANKGKTVFEHAYGYADRDRKTPNTVETKLNLGSINKRFTKTAIHMLAAQGKLSLADPVGKFLPDYPNKTAAEKVTIQQLLEMRSGIGDFFNERYERTPKERIRSIADYFPLFADKPLEFEPGNSRRYSNGGYIVLGAIIEKVSGKDYYTFVKENIFVPAGMLSTDAFEKDKEVPQRALGYTKVGDGTNGGWRSNYATLPGKGSSAGGGYSTVHDLLRFVQALEHGKLPAPDTEGGLGIAGGAPGLNAALEWDPASGYVIAVLSNFDPPSAEKVARQIRAWLPR
jgi:CubicO group peptidase (beta-lactamase class C family)